MWRRFPLLALLFVLAAAGFVVPAGDALGRAPRSGETAPEVREQDLPAEARDVIGRIRCGGPFRYERDGIVFGNREGLLPRRPRGYYTEYTVRTPGVRNRGARRIVAAGKPPGADGLYYTDDHYRSFRRIRERAP